MTLESRRWARGVVGFVALMSSACAHRRSSPAAAPPAPVTPPLVASAPTAPTPPVADPLAIAPVPPVGSLEDDLVITQESERIRVKALSTEAVFKGLTIDEFRVAYRSFYTGTRGKLEERWRRKPAGTALPSAALNDIAQQIVIHWFYFYNVNKLEVRVKERDLSHPETYRIVQQVIAKTFPQDTPEHTATCAALLDMTEHQFLDWERADKRMMDAF
jgi:hypothetical protein